jgi:hypothetical protein
VVLAGVSRPGYILAAVVLVSGTLRQLSYMVALLFQAEPDCQVPSRSILSNR